MPEWLDGLLKVVMPVIGVIVGAVIAHMGQNRLARHKEEKDQKTNAAFVAAVIREYQTDCEDKFFAARQYEEDSPDLRYHRPELPPPLRTDDLKQRAALLPPDVAKAVLELHVKAINTNSGWDTTEHIDPGLMQSEMPVHLALLTVATAKVVPALEAAAGWPVHKREPDDRLSWIEAFLADRTKKERSSEVNLD